jgi:hypothetical protein
MSNPGRRLFWDSVEGMVGMVSDFSERHNKSDYSHLFWGYGRTI